MLIRSGMGMQLSGSVGGVVASHNAGGAYLRNRSVPTNPNSARQQLMRGGMVAAAELWSGRTQAQREAWEAYAAGTPVVNRLGDSITLSGWNMFVRTYLFFRSCDASGSFLPDAPTVTGLNALGDNPSVTLQETDGITMSGVGSACDGPGLVQISPPLSPGVTFFRSPFTAFLTYDDFASESTTAAAGDQAVNRYGLPLENEIRCVRVQAIGTDNRLATPFETKVVVQAATP